MTSRSGLMGLVVVGNEGRMGRAIEAAAREASNCRIVGRINLEGRTVPTDTDGVVIVDFSCDDGTQSAIIAAKELGTPLLVGTTGLSPATIRTLERLSEALPVALVSNTSLGVVLLEYVARTVCQVLQHDASWSLDMVETHHRDKIDAPSGTAMTLAEVCRNSGVQLPQDRIQSIRRDDVVGTHELRFESGQEVLILRHEAKDRALFAKGALILARRLLLHAPGLYRAADLLELPRT